MELRTKCLITSNWTIRPASYFRMWIVASEILQATGQQPQQYAQATCKASATITSTISGLQTASRRIHPHNVLIRPTLPQYLIGITAANSFSRTYLISLSIGQLEGNAG